MIPVTTDDGLTLAAETGGAADGPTVVFVHAFPTNRTIWRPQIAALPARARWIAYDVRGFGQSDAPDDPGLYGQDRSVADLLCVLDHFGVDQALLCGLSMGGNIVLNFAFAHPERVAALVISGTGSGTGNHADFVRMVEAWAVAAESRGLEAFAEAAMAAPIFAEYTDRGAAEHRHMHDLIFSSQVAGVVNSCRRVLAVRPVIDTLKPKLATLRRPTVVVTGARDEAVMLASAIMAETIPGARYVEVPETGHFNNLESPAALDAVLADLLERL